jgi:hypothetical protein
MTTEGGEGRPQRGLPKRKAPHGRGAKAFAGQNNENEVIVNATWIGFLGYSLSKSF